MPRNAAGSAALTSARPPVLISGASSDVTNSIFIEAIRSDIGAQAPDVAIVIAYGAIAGKLAACRRIQDAHAGPAFLIPIGQCHRLLRRHIAAKIAGRAP